VQAWTSQPEVVRAGSRRLLSRCITSEYLGVGYIIGPRVSGILFAGGIISWLVMMPAIKFYGQLAGNTPIYPSTIPIPQIHPTICGQLYPSMERAQSPRRPHYPPPHNAHDHFCVRAGLKDVRAEGAGQSTASSRIDRDVPMRWVIVGSVLIVAMIWVLLTFFPIEGAQTQWYQNLFAGIFVSCLDFSSSRRGPHQWTPRQLLHPSAE